VALALHARAIGQGQHPRLIQMKILDRYILKKILSTFFFVVIMLTSVIVMITLTEKMDAFARNNLGARAIVGYFIDFIPWITGQLFPITVFIATVFVTSRMAAHTEIVAILSSGTSFNRFLLPYFISSVLIAGLTFWLNGWIIPKATLSRLAFELKYFENKVSFDKRNVHMQIAPNVYLFLQSYNNHSDVGYQFSLEKFDSGRLIEKLTADNIQWDSVKNKWQLSRWKVNRVEAMFTKTAGPGPFVSQGDKMDTTLAITPNDFENEDGLYNGMTIPELNETIKKRRFRGLTGVEVFETEKHIRYAVPFTTFILVFIGVIVSSRKSRGGTGLQVALGFMLAFAFILLFTVSRTFAEAGAMPPEIAAWLPNVIFALVSLGLYRYVPR
jgi:lipopolysaccharide export system permease protein